MFKTPASFARLAGAALLLVILLAGCAAPGQPPATDAQAASTPVQTAASTDTPVAAVSNTPAPGDTQMAVFTSQYGVSFQYPKAWGQMQTERQVESFHATGATSPGFVSLTPLGAGSDYQDLARRCAWEANGSPSLYGDQPQIQMGELELHNICIIQTSLSGIKASAAFLFLANTGAGSQVIRLTMDPTHMQAIAQSLHFKEAQPTATPEPVQMTPQPPVKSTETVRLLGGLQLSEYSTVNAGDDTPTHFEFENHIPRELLAKRVGWGTYAQDEGLDRTNLQLEPFGYSLEMRQVGSEVRYDLRKGSGIVKPDLLQYYAPSIHRDAQGGDFAMIVEDSSWHRWLVRKDSLEPWDDMLYRYTRPVFVGSHLISVEHVPWTNASDQGYRVFVKQDDQSIFTYTLATEITCDSAKTLDSWDGHWVLEINGTLLVDGVNWNQKDFPADEIFNWTQLNGKPFFFFRRDGKVGAWYDGQELPVQYDQVIHYRCCEPAAFNITSSPDGLWFYALRDGVWYFVSLTK